MGLTIVAPAPAGAQESTESPQTPRRCRCLSANPGRQLEMDGYGWLAIHLLQIVAGKREGCQSRGSIAKPIPFSPIAAAVLPGIVAGDRPENEEPGWMDERGDSSGDTIRPLRTTLNLPAVLSTSNR